MKLPEHSRELEKKEYWVALALAVFVLAVYVRTLAPDVLYGDSAEFQTLAYTFGITHSTGYPIYLLLGRFIGFLPIHSPAWRISLLSAVNASITVGGIYLLTRYFTRSRLGAVLGAMALGVSYTFWSQAVIAEVYTSGTAFIVAITSLLFYWQADPTKHNRVLLAAALLAGLGFGVHASVWLVAPPALALVIWTLWWRHASRSEWLHAVTSGAVGAIIGVSIFLIAFYVSYRLDPTTSFIRTTLEPSRSFWNLEPADFESPLRVLKMTVFSVQWGDALFSSQDHSFVDETKNFIGRLAGREFSPQLTLVAIAGMVIMLVTQPVRALFYPLTFLLSLFFILNYRVEDKYVFYLSLYIPFAVAAGTGMGFVLEWIRHSLGSVPDPRYPWLNLLPVLFFVTLVVQPVASIRWRAIQSGVADFVTDDYQYPVADLKQPRLIAQRQLAGVDPNAVFVLEWRVLYATAYVAQVEKQLTDTIFLEAMPHGDNGSVASTLVMELKGYLQEGRPVFTDQRYPGLDEHFRLLPASGNLYKLSLKK